MKAIKILGVILIVLSIGLFGLSAYISERVAHGERRIANAERQVEQARGLFEITPFTGEVGDVLTDEAQEQIDFKKGEAGYYADKARQYRSFAIGLLVFGIALLLAVYIFSIRTR
jgi:hypothetical protein